MTSGNSSSYYVLFGLVAIIALEPVVAKWRFPSFNDIAASAAGDRSASASSSSSSSSSSSTATTNNGGTCSAEDVLLGVCNNDDEIAKVSNSIWELLFGSSSSSDGGGGGGGRGKLSLLDWQHLKESTAVKLPMQAASIAKRIILYQPPVGIVTAWTTYRLLKSGRLWRWMLEKDDADDANGVDGRKGGSGGARDGGGIGALSKKSSKLDRHMGRALDLDKDDLEYQKYGGIERVRRRLLWQALEEASETISQDDVEGGADPLQDLMAALIQLMKLSFPPGGSHANYANQLLRYMADAEYAWIFYRQNSRSVDPSLHQLLELAMQTAENRVLDSLVRLTRDRLVRTSFRLSRTVHHWKRRVQSQSGMLPFVRHLMMGSFEGDRMRLAFAESAYNSEVARLGKVVRFLLQRPEGLDDSYLQMAVKKTHEAAVLQSSSSSSSPPLSPALRRQQQQHQQPTTQSKRPSQSGWKKLFPHLPNISNWSIRFNADGRGKIQVQKYEDTLRIGGPGATAVLLEETDQKEWMKESQEWSQQARSLLIDVVEETMETSLQGNLENNLHLQKLKSTWKVKEYSEGRGNMEVVPEDIVNQWDLLFGLVRELHQFRRVGDGKSVKWKDANIIHFVRQFDLLGVPSAVLHIGLAQIVHNRLLPHWPKMKAVCQESFEVVNEIFQSRFWGPIRDLLTELMYRDTNSLLTGISVHDEETSLDFMLRDLDFGDGTPESRHEAIIKATRQYENDMATGLMRHALGGRLIRLILIQIQQLKVGMLHAADTVDVLLQTNRFNIQLLAVIPAFVIVTVGSKVLFRFLFTVRHKDLRPMRAVHGEMAGYLNKLESILLLVDTTQSIEGDEQGGSNGNRNQNGNRKGSTTRATTTTSSSSASTATTTATSTAPTALDVMSYHELGEFVLNLYDYLVLLDYSSPQPFPASQCDTVHQSMVELLGPKGSLSRMGLPDQLRFIDHVKSQHEDLAKHL